MRSLRTLPTIFNCFKYSTYVVVKPDGVSWSAYENLYCIDYDEESVKMVRKENVYQQLIFQDTINQYLAFMKGNFDENQGIASIQLIPFSKIEGAQSKTVVEKKYDQKKMKGEWI